MYRKELLLVVLQRYPSLIVWKTLIKIIGKKIKVINSNGSAAQPRVKGGREYDIRF